MVEGSERVGARGIGLFFFPNIASSTILKHLKSAESPDSQDWRADQECKEIMQRQEG